MRVAISFLLALLASLLGKTIVVVTAASTGDPGGLAVSTSGLPELPTSIVSVLRAGPRNLKGKGGGKGRCKSMKKMMMMMKGRCPMMKRTAPTPTAIRSTPAPVAPPTPAPSSSPSSLPSSFPTTLPSSSPSSEPSVSPSSFPTALPSSSPSSEPSVSPSSSPTKQPTKPPTKPPTKFPTSQPTNALSCASLSKGSNNHLYGVLSLEWLSFKEARDYIASLNQCCGKRAHPVSITSQTENAFVVATLAPFVRPPPVLLYAMTGLNNIVNSTVYAWDGTNETVANSGGYVNWCSRQNGGCFDDVTPSSDDDRPFCMVMNVDGGKWFPVDCVVTFSLIVVEYDCA